MRVMSFMCSKSRAECQLTEAVFALAVWHQGTTASAFQPGHQALDSRIQGGLGLSGSCDKHAAILRASFTQLEALFLAHIDHVFGKTAGCTTSRFLLSLGATNS
jgi:hypothetical protein